MALSVLRPSKSALRGVTRRARPPAELISSEAEIGHISSPHSLVGIKIYTYFYRMESIVKLWFKNGRIYILTDQGNTYSRPLEAFPLLLEATPEQREAFEIGSDGDDIRWEELDEDIHISSFHETAEPNSDNPIAEVFHRFPQLNVSEMARTIGINKSLLSRYIYGIKKPSAERTEQILNALRQLGRDLADFST